jgi:hypothetical protein
LGEEFGAGELVEAGDDGGAEGAASSEAASHGDVAGDGDLERERGFFGAMEKGAGCFFDDGWVIGGGGGGLGGFRKRDFIVEIDREAEGVEA